MKDLILKELRQAEGYISGERLSELCGVSRTAIWKHIKTLQQEGYQIESQHGAGYRLVGMADVLNARELADHLQGSCFAPSAKIHCYQEVTSTNTVAKELAQKAADRQAKQGIVVTAENQTAGKGRLGRPWTSAQGTGICCSVVLAPMMTLAEASRFSFIAATAIAEGVRRYTGLDVQIKWPNDLVLNGRKICGILVEMVAEAEHVDYFVLGFGLNVNQTSADFPQEIAQKATSLAIQSGVKIDRMALLCQILLSIEEHLALYQSQGFAPIRQKWLASACFLGEKVVIRQQERIIDEGTVQGIDEDGALLLERPDGQTVRILAGDVSLRQADGRYC